MLVLYTDKIPRSIYVTSCASGIARCTAGRCGLCTSGDVWVKALLDYNAPCEEELSFIEGQIICVRSKQPNGVDDGWWIGESNGNVGLFPSMMVEELTPETIFVSDWYTVTSVILQSYCTVWVKKWCHLFLR